MFQPDILFGVIVLIFSVIIHEVSHGYVAEYLGDPTARLAGRLTLNPARHIDLFGSVLVPLGLILTHQPFILGWAKPVPYNPYNLKDPQKGGGLIALAGPLSNLVVAGVLGVCVRLMLASPGLFGVEQTLAIGEMLVFVVSLNIWLALFNLIPIPPIDGSKVLALVLPRRAQLHLDAFWARIGLLIQENLIISLILLFLFLPYLLTPLFIVLDPVRQLLFSLFVGGSF